MPDVSVVLPCLNEAETIGLVVAKARAALDRDGLHGEVIVADNGSTDGSADLARASGARVVIANDKGYGSALMEGIRASQGTFIVMADADDSYDVTAIKAFVDALESGLDLVLGNRFAGGIQQGAMPPLHRYIGNPILSFLGRAFFGSPVGDFHCGMRGFRRQAILDLNLRTTGMEFASEMVVKSTLARLRVGEIPTTLRPSGRSRAPHLRTWRDGWRHLRFLLLYSPRWLFLFPGLMLMFLGLGVGVWLIPGPRHVGTVTLDVQTLLAASVAVILGFQSLIFAVLTKVFSITEGLLPPDPRVDRLLERVTLETGLVAGAILVLAGLAGASYSFAHWSSLHFGPVNAGRSLRVVIPSLTALVLGVQTILSSFFLSVLGLRRR